VKKGGVYETQGITKLIRTEFLNRAEMPGLLEYLAMLFTVRDQMLPYYNLAPFYDSGSFP